MPEYFSDVLNSENIYIGIYCSFFLDALYLVGMMKITVILTSPPLLYCSSLAASLQPGVKKSSHYTVCGLAATFNTTTRYKGNTT